MLDRLGLRLRVFLFFALIAFGGSAVFVAALAWLGQRGGALKVDDLVLMGGGAAAVLLGLTAWAWLKCCWIWANSPKPGSGMKRR